MNTKYLEKKALELRKKTFLKFIEKEPIRWGLLNDRNYYLFI